VHVHRLIDQGNFRCVCTVQDARSCQLYALKQVDCRDEGQAEQCRQEVALHRLLHDDNLMPLLGVKFVQESMPSVLTMTCYVLFPCLSRSLRADISKRRLLEETLESKRRPCTQTETLTLFAGIVSAAKAMHEAGFGNHDIRVENVLLQQKLDGQRQRRDVGTAVLSDFGSAGPVVVPLPSLRDIWHAMEDAGRHTTMAYRAPELFGGGLSHGPLEFLHCDCADVWSLGCLLFAILNGSSPFEMEWRVSLLEKVTADGAVRFVESTHAKTSGPGPFPPCGIAADRRHGEDIKDLMRWMLKKAGRERPSISEVLKKVAILADGKDTTTNSHQTLNPAVDI